MARVRAVILGVLTLLVFFETNSARASATKPEQTVWALSEIATGPVPAVARLLYGTPIIGGFIHAPLMTQSHTYITLLEFDIRRILRACGYGEGLIDHLDISGSFFENVSSYRTRLISLDDALALCAKRISHRGMQSLQERQRNAALLIYLKGYRETLGVPPVVTSAEDVQNLVGEGKLKIGDLYRTPAGQVIIVKKHDIPPSQSK